MWDKLKSLCSETGLGVVYSILQELLTYPKINKPKGFNKSVTSVFVDVQFLCKRLRAAITPNKDIWDSIAIVVAIDSLRKDFDLVTAGLLGQGGDKAINKIQQILALAEAKFISKRAVGVIAICYKTTLHNKNERSHQKTKVLTAIK